MAYQVNRAVRSNVDVRTVGRRSGDADKMKVIGKRRGISDTKFGLVVVAITLVFMAIGLGFISVLSDQQSTIRTNEAQIQAQLQALQSNPSKFNASSLPLMNQTTTIRELVMTWYKSPQAHQDRFDPSFPVVNQGDTIQLTLIDNDTVAHDLVIGPPYDIVVNATVPGLVNDLTGQTFSTPAKNNSPGVVVKGAPGNVSANFSFVAKYAGVYEFVCTYHAQVGMIGYLVVLPNAAYAAKSLAGHPSTNPGTAKVNIVPGAGSNTSSKGYSPGLVTVTVSGNDTVTWINNDNAPHTVTANDGSFSSGNIAPGASFSYTFTKSGTFKYHCVYHPWMTGVVVVN
ncbi:MAG TPA: cupredoxin domain-containing protein [Nitrososphaerales archaeon]|nr:cupredoxin domain-containing protein [Nitrososphaerales archaeon]